MPIKTEYTEYFGDLTKEEQREIEVIEVDGMANDATLRTALDSHCKAGRQLAIRKTTFWSALKERFREEWPDVAVVNGGKLYRRPWSPEN